MLPNETQQDPPVTHSSATAVLGRGRTKQEPVVTLLLEKAQLSVSTKVQP